jgi:hypothetical protein
VRQFIKQADIKSNSLEELFMEPLDATGRVRMSDEHTGIFMQIGMMSRVPEAVDDMYKKMSKMTWTLEAISKRIEVCLSITVDKAVLIWLATMTNGNIGTMVMYVYYLQYWGKKNDERHITFDMLAMRIFPTGFFEREALNAVWDATKVDREDKRNASDNLIDYPVAAESIQFKD